MNQGVGIAARLLGSGRKSLAIQALSGSETVSGLAVRHGVSRKFVYQQTHKARAALDDAFASATPDSAVLFELAVTKVWLRQVIVALTLIGRSSYRGVVEFLRDLLGVSVSIGCVHGVLQAATHQASTINRIGQHDPDHELAAQLALARQSEAQANWLARDIRTLMHWLRHDVLALAGPDLATRRELFDFLVAELAAREHEDPRRIRPVRVALQNQRDDLLAFAGQLDAKLADVAHALAVPEPLVRETCLLHRLPTTSPAYWQGWNRLRAQAGGKFHALVAAVGRAMVDTPRSSALVENLNSRLRTYFTLRRHLGGAYLDLLRFFLNHRRFLRSRHAERQGRSPRELMTGQDHPHWLTLLGLGELQPRRA